MPAYDISKMKVPNGALIFDDGTPRLTYGGFVGSAEIDPKYAVKVKNANAYVDLRDFFPPFDSTRNPRRHAASSTLRGLRQSVYARQMAAEANIKCNDTLTLSNGDIVSASISRVDKHLIATTKQDCSDVKDKIKSQLKVRIATERQEPTGETIYTTTEIDPLECEIEGFVAAKEKNLIEQNDVSLRIPESVILKSVPSSVQANLERYKRQNGEVSLTVPISSVGWDPLGFSRGFTIDLQNELTPLMKPQLDTQVAVIAKPASEATSPNIYLLDNIDDLMAAIQDSRNVVPNFDWGNLFKVVTPMVGPLVSGIVQSFDSTRVSRNGYCLDDIENVHHCKNFTELCQLEGYKDIPTMLSARNASNGPNFIDWLINLIPSAVEGIISLFDSGAEGNIRLEPGEVDYRDKPYPLEPSEYAIESMDTSGVGAKVAHTTYAPYPKNLEKSSSEEEQKSNILLEADHEYSVGNSIPRYLSWDLDPDFSASGGTQANVGEYLQYAEFDFSRIQVHLVDANGFAVPCNTNVLSVLNFDSSHIGTGVATIKFSGQGSTALTATFPYKIVDTPICTILSDIICKELFVGSKIDPAWVVNVVSDSPMSGSGYKNLCALTTAGFTLGAYDSKKPGEQFIDVHPVGASADVKSTIRVIFKENTQLTTIEAREKYLFDAYLNVKATYPGLALSKNDIEFTLYDTATKLPVFYSTAANEDVIKKVMNNGSESLLLIEGPNVFTIETAKAPWPAPPLIWSFTELVKDTLDHIEFGWQTGKNKLTIYDENRIVGNGGLQASDFVCRLHYSAGDPKELRADKEEYDIEPIYPLIFDGDKGLGKCYIRPTNIKDISPAVLGSLKNSVEVIVKRENVEDSPVYTLNGIRVTLPDGYSPNIGDWFDPHIAKLEVVYKVDGTTSEIAIPLNSDMATWSVGNNGAFLRFTSAGVTAIGAKIDDKTTSVEVSVGSKKLSAISATLKASDNHVAFGTILTPSMFAITGTYTDGSTEEITSAVSVANYYPTQAGEQSVQVVYGEPSASTAKNVKVTIVVDEPVIADLKAIPNTTQFEKDDVISASDFTVTAITNTGIEFEIPSSEVGIAEFDNKGGKDQTGMVTVMYPKEGIVKDGSISTASFKFDTGEGGGVAKFEMPILACSFTKPYCFVGDTPTKESLGLERAYILAQNGTREYVDTEKIRLGTVDTSKAGSVEVDVDYIGEE